MKMANVFLTALLVLPLFLTRSLAAPPQSQGAGYLVYVASKGSHSEGIYAYRFDENSGEMAALGLAAETPSPFWLLVSRDGRFLYAANIIGDFHGQASGSVSAFGIDSPSGKLRLLDQVATLGADPCYLSLDRTGRFLLVANYSGGSVAVLPVRADGSLGEVTSFVQHAGSGSVPKRQQDPHPHAIAVSPDNRYALAADLGLDQLLVYRFHPATGSLTRASPPFATLRPGSGPRHFVFSPDGKFVYVTDELGSTITVFSYRPEPAALRVLQVVSILPAGFAGKNTGAEIAVAPSGRFLYASNRGADTIAVFAIDPQSGSLAPLGWVPTLGKTPGMFAIDPSGSYLFVANHDSDNVVVFRIDQEGRQLTPTGKVIDLPGPDAVAFVPAH
jgi:6-phosphogluconolactonase